MLSRKYFSAVPVSHVLISKGRSCQRPPAAKANIRTVDMARISRPRNRTTRSFATDTNMAPDKISSSHPKNVEELVEGSSAVDTISVSRNPSPNSSHSNPIASVSRITGAWAASGAGGSAGRLRHNATIASVARHRIAHSRLLLETVPPSNSRMPATNSTKCGTTILKDGAMETLVANAASRIRAR